jgi:hypothetical protein
MDKLEEHIRKNREDLDRYNPPASIWRNIRKDVKRGKSPLRQWLSLAAMVVIIIGLVTLFLKPGYNLEKTGKDQKSENDISQIAPQLKETEVYYNNLVNSLYKEAAPMLTNNPEIKNELNSDLSHLDSMCVDIKKDLKDNISNKDVVEALINNYRIKIHILEDMLRVLRENETTPEKKKSHEL